MRNHTRDNCFYEHPKKAPAGWKPSNEVRAAAYVAYMQKKQQDVAKPAAAAVDTVKGVRWADIVEQEEQQAAAAAALSYNDPPWYLGGAALQSSAVEFAAAAARGTQPHGFWLDSLPPRASASAGRVLGSGTGKTYRSATAVPDTVRVQVDLQVPYDRLSALLELAGQRERQSGEAGDVSSSAAATTAGQNSGTEAAVDSMPAAAAATGFGPELQLNIDPDELQQLLALYNSECEVQTLYTFTGTTPETGVSVNINGRHVLVGRATQDGGCVPNLMSKRFADAAGIHYSPGADRVQNIEGELASHMKWHTQPLKIVLARNTPGELVLDVPDSFTVVDGDNAAEMYDIVLGRKALAKVSGFVMPLLRKFYYVPRLQQKDTSLCSLPIMVGYNRKAIHPSADCAAAFDLPCSYWVAGACLQDESPVTAPSSEPHQACTAPTDAAPTPGSCAKAVSISAPESATAPRLAKPKRRDSSSMLMLLLWPLLWMFGAIDSFCNIVMQERPYKDKLYYRLGRYHRAEDGEQIRLHLTPGSHGNKPKVVAVHSRHVSWRFALTTLSARAVLLLVLLLFFGIAGTTAMQTVNAVPPVAQVSTSFIMPPLPRLTGPQLLLASLDQMVGGTFRLFTR
jgi:hypothetical protein